MIKPICCRFALLAITGIVALSSCSTGRQYGDRSERYTRGRKPGNARPVIETEKPEKETYVIKPSSGQLNAAGALRMSMVKEAGSYAGIPYRYGGKSPAEGFDCSGFANYIYNRFGFKTAGPTHELALLGVPKERSTLQAGDLVFFGSDEKISHVGIVVTGESDKLTFIHSSTSSGIRTDAVDGSEYWEKRYLFGRDLISGFMAVK